jgi:hypothetical protein
VIGLCRVCVAGKAHIRVLEPVITVNSVEFIKVAEVELDCHVMVLDQLIALQIFSRERKQIEHLLIIPAAVVAAVQVIYEGVVGWRGIALPI